MYLHFYRCACWPNLVSRLDIVCVILAIVAKHGWHAHHLGVKSTFLNAELEAEVCLTQPEGDVMKGKDKQFSDCVWLCMAFDRHLGHGMLDMIKA